MPDDYMLTTTDNPYDPFDEFTLWFMFDIEMGYNTCGRLARLTHVTDDMTQKEINDEIDRAMDFLIEYDFMDIYIKVQPKK